MIGLPENVAVRDQVHMMGVGEFLQLPETLLIVLHKGRGEADMYARFFQREDRPHGFFPRTGQRGDAVVASEFL